MSIGFPRSTLCPGSVQMVSAAPSTESCCPLFPQRQLSSPTACPLEVENLRLPTFQRHGRTVVDTKQLYKTLRQMHREGRTSSLRPTIIISTKPLTQTAIQHESMLMNEMEKEKVRDTEMEKRELCDAVLVKETTDGLVVVSGENQPKQPALSNPLSSTLELHANVADAVEITSADEYDTAHSTDDESEHKEESARFFFADEAEYESKARVSEELNNGFENELENGERYSFENDQQQSVKRIDMNVGRITRIPITHHSHTASIFHASADTVSGSPSPSLSAESPSNESSSFSLHQLTSMLMTLLMVRSVQKSDNDESNASGLQLVMVNLALVI